MADRRSRGRPRDRALDEAILAAARAVLVEHGVDGVTYERVAAIAGTNRPTLYRRYASRTELVVEALASFGTLTTPSPTGDHLEDLIAELTSFRDAIERAGSITLVGSMLLASTEHEAKAAYRERIVGPRRQRIGALLDAAAGAGLLTAGPEDRALAVTMCTGSWYAMALAGQEPPPDWPRRTAEAVWIALGGSP